MSILQNNLCKQFKSFVCSFKVFYESFYALFYTNKFEVDIRDISGFNKICGKKNILFIALLNYLSRVLRYTLAELFFGRS